MAWRRLMAAQRVLYLTRTLTQFHPPPHILPPHSVPLHCHRRLSSTEKTSNGEDTGISAVTQRIREFISSDKVIVFMKGVPERPMCGFSRAVVQILQLHGVQFSAFNVLDDEEVRAGIKEHTGWPTIPQVFFNGELIGGMDILLQMHQNKEILTELEKIGITSSLASDAD